MLDSVLPTPVKLTYSEILLSAAATLAFQAIEKSGRPIVHLSELCEKPQYGYTASAQAEAAGPRFLRITDVKAGSVDWNTVPYCDCPEPEKYLLKPDDILVARSGSVGKSFLVSECPEPTVFASYMIRIRAKSGVLAGYIYWLLQTRQFWLQIRESKRGSAMKNINSKMLSSVRIPDATPSQQNAVVSFLTWFQGRLNGDYEAPPPDVPELLDTPRIVARIEELAALIEEAQGLRAKAREEAEALLAAAVKVVFDNRQWTQITIEELVGRENLKNGRSVKTTELPTDIRCLRLSSLRGGRIDCTDAKPVLMEQEEAEPYLIREGDVFVVRGSGSKGLVGQAGLIEECIEGTIFPDLFIRVPLDQNRILSSFFVAWWNSPKMRDTIEDTAKTTSGIWKINQRHVASFSVPLPPLSEQRRIVAYLDGLRAQVDELATLQDATQAELDTLLPSVLDKAFRGEL
jgi:type I restriction enzyme S subunit